MPASRSSPARPRSPPRSPTSSCEADDAEVWYDVIRHMKRTTIFMPETLERDLQLYARRAGRPVASVVREAVEQYLTQAGAGAALPSFAAIGASGRTGVAARHEALLFRELGPQDNGVPAPSEPKRGRVEGYRRPQRRSSKK